MDFVSFIRILPDLYFTISASCHSRQAEVWHEQLYSPYHDEAIVYHCNQRLWQSCHDHSPGCALFLHMYAWVTEQIQMPLASYILSLNMILQI